MPSPSPLWAISRRWCRGGRIFDVGLRRWCRAVCHLLEHVDARCAGTSAYRRPSICAGSLVADVP
eukprot:5909885-Pyramimonas_sp.AAC.1